MDAGRRLIQLDNTVYNFDINISEMLDAVDDYINQREFDIYCILYANKHEKIKQYLVERYEKTERSVYMVNYQTPRFQYDLRRIAGYAENEETKEIEKKIVYIVLGDDTEDHLKTTSFLQVYVHEEGVHEAVLISEGIYSKYFDNIYGEYVKGITIVTNSLMVGDERSNTFTRNYKENYGELPELNAYYAHDIIMFINKTIFLNLEKSHYLTGIEGFREDEPVRNINFYKIIGDRKIIKLDEVVSRQEPEDADKPEVSENPENPEEEISGAPGQEFETY